MDIPQVHHRFVEVDGVRVFYRETGPAAATTVLLLHGFPSSSHQFRRLIDALGTRYHLVAPDHPGFGHTESPNGFRYSFDELARVVEGFVQTLNLTRFVMYLFDFGGPVGFRLATRQPDRIAGLVIQNANAYLEGLSEAARELTANHPGIDGAEGKVPEILAPSAIRRQYEVGTTDLELVDPGSWTLDQHFIDQPGRASAQVDLALDYHTNLALYPDWQRWLRERQPPALILWGRGDPFFIEAGARAYLRDLPDARLHLFETGHFALEENLPEIAPLIAKFLDSTIRPPRGDIRSPMKLAIIGATGTLGSAVAREATARGHQVTQLSRRAVDITDPASIKDAVTGHDAVVAAVKGPHRVVPKGAKALLEALPPAKVGRLVFLGGGGSLDHVPGRRFVDSPEFPAQYLETAQDQAEALDILRAADTPVRWSYISPPPVHLIPGAKTGIYRAEARDTPITDSDGQSRITVGDYASAVVDALEYDSFVGERFTVAY